MWTLLASFQYFIPFFKHLTILWSLCHNSQLALFVRIMFKEVKNRPKYAMRANYTSLVFLKIHGAFLRICKSSWEFIKFHAISQKFMRINESSWRNEMRYSVLRYSIFFFKRYRYKSEPRRIHESFDPKLGRGSKKNSLLVVFYY